MHFSTGFVINPSPNRPVYSQCSYVNYGNEVMAIWPRETGFNCHETGCAPRGAFCIYSGDDAYLIFSVYDSDGDEFDISGASEIVFAVADKNGGEVRIVKRLTSGEIVISSNMYQFMVSVDSVDTESLSVVNNYYEARITSSSGLNHTVSSGLFKCDKTIIKDIV